MSEEISADTTLIRSYDLYLPIHNLRKRVICCPHYTVDTVHITVGLLWRGTEARMCYACASSYWPHLGSLHLPAAVPLALIVNEGLAASRASQRVNELLNLVRTLSWPEETCPHCAQTESWCSFDTCRFVCANGTECLESPLAVHDERTRCTLQEGVNGKDWICIYCCRHDGACAERRVNDA